VLLAAKFLPGLGAVMPPFAGALGMRPSRFLLFDTLGSLFYASFYVLTGFVFHNQLQQAMELLKELGFSILLLMMLLLTSYVIFKYARRRGPFSKRNRKVGRSQGFSVTNPKRDAGRTQEPVVDSGAARLKLLGLGKATLAITAPSPGRNFAANSTWRQQKAR
jgi:hypothetical protein